MPPLAGAAGISVEAMRQAILEFRGVPHRLEIIAEQAGVTWVNDSIATAPERVVAALQSFSEPLILLAGGRDKDLPWAELVGVAVERCKVVITFGEFGPEIARLLNYAQRGKLSGQLQRIEQVATLDEAVQLAQRATVAGDVVLLSPGGTSFDAYRDFAERGEHFRSLVARLHNQSD
ncbi:MAG: hypothetical protein HC915_19935 [Anaerolineae bacterium]|nr:hypothetical protein [Anaerolineae bacterium]